jgi:hypothetical protein
MTHVDADDDEKCLICAVTWRVGVFDKSVQDPPSHTCTHTHTHTVRRRVNTVKGAVQETGDTILQGRSAHDTRC